MTEANDHHTTPTPNPAKHPDAAIIHLCARHPALLALAHFERDDDAAPAWLAYDRSRKAIDQCQPKTLAGLMAMARVAKWEVRKPDGGEYNHEGTPASGWAWQIVNHLLAIEGELA